MTEPAIPAPPAPKPSNQEVQKYIDSAMKRLEENPEWLEVYERRLLGKIKKSSQGSQQAMKDVGDLKNQVAQAEARIHALELQSENLQGSVNAYIDEIVSVKFNIEEPFNAPPKTPEVPPADDAKGKKLKAIKGEKDLHSPKES